MGKRLIAFLGDVFRVLFSRSVLEQAERSFEKYLLSVSVGALVGSYGVLALSDHVPMAEHQVAATIVLSWFGAVFGFALVCLVVSFANSWVILCNEGDVQ